MPFSRVCAICGSGYSVISRMTRKRCCCADCTKEWRSRRLIANNPNESEEVRKIKSEKMKAYRLAHPVSGKNNPFFGRTHSNDLKKRFREERRGVRFYNEEQFKRQNENTPKGCNHPMWKGGISYLPYDSRFTRRFKTEIKKRDGNVCVECNCAGRLAVHHIDYNKQNTVPENCITLCLKCHGKTNVLDRDSMTAYFQEKYKEKLHPYVII
jgi:hypothetical protein